MGSGFGQSDSVRVEGHVPAALDLLVNGAFRDSGVDHEYLATQPISIANFMPVILKGGKSRLLGWINSSTFMISAFS